jgi:ribosomal protein S18 acetylase RimI-like enzyme
MFSATQIAGVTFCRGNVDDAAELADFAAQTFNEAFAAMNHPDNMDAHLAASYSVTQQAEELTDPQVATILARSNGELVAYAQVRRNAPPPCVTQAAAIELHRFYLDRRVQGTGLASTLMQEVHVAAREFQGQHLWLGVWEQNPRAIAFYEKAMFVDVGSTFYRVGPDKQIDRVLVAVVPATTKTYPGNQ